MKIAEVARRHAISPHLVRYTIEKDPVPHHGKSVSRAGRPKTTTTSDKRYICQIVKRDPYINYDDIRLQTALALSNRTLLRIVHKSGYGHWRAIYRLDPMINQCTVNTELRDRFRTGH